MSYPRKKITMSGSMRNHDVTETKSMQNSVVMTRENVLRITKHKKMLGVKEGKSMKKGAVEIMFTRR